MKNITLFVLCLLISKTSFAIGIESDSGIEGPSYQQIESELVSLANESPDLATRFVYGITPQGRNLNMLRIARMDPNDFNGSGDAIIITGSIHGDEYLGFEDKMPRWLLSLVGKNQDLDTFLEKGGVIYVAPVINPDGYSMRTRENSHGKDLNRDFSIQVKNYTGFKETESKDLFNFIAKDTAVMQVTPFVSVDYHCCVGALFYPWSFASPLISTAEYNRLKVLGNEFLSIFKGYEYSTTPNSAGYSAVGTFKDALYENYHSYSYTFEGLYEDEAKNFDLHKKFWLRTIQMINNKSLIHN